MLLVLAVVVVAPSVAAVVVVPCVVVYTICFILVSGAFSTAVNQAAHIHSK